MPCPGLESQSIVTSAAARWNRREARAFMKTDGCGGPNFVTGVTKFGTHDFIHFQIARCGPPMVHVRFFAK